MQISIKKMIFLAVAALTIGSVCAQSYPSKPIKILVGFSPGGSADALARVYAKKLQEVLNTPVIVENKPGASQLVASRSLMASAPDGYTFWFATSSALVQLPAIRSDLPYDPLKSFSLVAQVAEVDAVFGINSDLPVHDVKDFISLLKQKPGQLNYASAGIGTANHLLTEYFKILTETSITHVPYKSDGEVARELISGGADFAVIATGSLPQVMSQAKFRALSVVGPHRIKSLPDVPTLAESGVPELEKMNAYVFYGLIGPAKLPQPIVQMLSDVTIKIVNMPEMQAMLENLYMRPSSGSSDALRKRIEKDLRSWREVGKKLKLNERNS